MIEKSDANWWWGSANNHIAWFPASFVRLRIEQTKNSEIQKNPKEMKIRIREKVVQEIVQSERDYVRHLKGLKKVRIILKIFFEKWVLYKIWPPRLFF